MERNDIEKIKIFIKKKKISQSPNFEKLTSIF